METIEAIHTRRSVRAYVAQPVPDDLLRQVLQAGAASASPGNTQPWGYVLLRSPQRLAGLRSLAPGMIGQPAAVITICLDADRAGRSSGGGAPRMAWMDIGLTTQNLLWAAHSLGLGACAIGSFHRQGVAVYLSLPPGGGAGSVAGAGVPGHQTLTSRPTPRVRSLFSPRVGEAL